MSPNCLRLKLFALTLFACVSAAALDELPASRLPYIPSLDPEAMDRTANPCDDLYQYACGGWIRNNPIPADQSRWSTYDKAYVDNQRYLLDILQEDSVVHPQRSATQALVGDYFAACMNEAGIETLGSTPLDADLQAIDSLEDKRQLAGLIGHLISHTDASAFFLAIGSEQDAEDSSKMIAALYAGGLGLPDRDYYFDASENKTATRQVYLTHVAAMFELLGEPAERAQGSAAAVLRIETGLAAATLTQVERRDPHKVYHRKSAAEIAEVAPGFDWAALFARTGLVPDPWVNLSQPDFVAAMQATIERESLDDLKTYLRWGLVNTRAPLLSKSFRDENFAFYSTHLRGIKEQRPRWRTCVNQVDTQLGEVLGREFVERMFPPELREKVLRMARQIQQAMAERIDQLAWMSPQTRAQAHAKLQKMRNKIGYPQTWRDYSSISISRDDYFGNVTRATGFDLKRQLDRIGKPVDRGEWFLTPATVNAGYNPSMNDLTFPAAVLMPPLYDPALDDAPNYGDTGGTIGHELVHGFDDEGRQFDGDGNLRDWWTAEDAAAFEQRAQCIRDQYAAYPVIDDIFINSRLTAGEDIADLGGLILAWQAWKIETADKTMTDADGLSPEQRFFVGFAQWACADERPEALRLHAATDPHSPLKYRVNGVVINMPEFARAFNCKAGSALVKAKQDICRIW